MCDKDYNLDAYELCLEIFRRFFYIAFLGKGCMNLITQSYFWLDRGLARRVWVWVWV